MIPLRFFLLYSAGSAADERLAALAADPALAAERYQDVAALGERLAALDEALVPVLIVAAGVAQAEQAVQHLQRVCRPLQTVLLSARGDDRSLGGRFRRLPVRARQLDLLPQDHPELAAALLTLGEAARQRALHRQVVERSEARLQALQPQALDLTAEPIRRQVTDTLPLGLVLLTPEGYVAESNACAHHFLGETTAAAPAHIAELVPAWAGVAPVEIPADTTITVSGGGRIHHLRARTACLGPREQPQGWVVTVADVTEQEQARRVLAATAEELQARASAESQAAAQVRQERDATQRFIATLTHDLRSPLAAASTSGQLLQRKLSAQPAEGKLLARMQGSLKRAERMIEDLLDLSRAEVGRSLTINPTTLRLDQLLQETLEDLERVHGRAFALEQPLPDQKNIFEPFYRAEAPSGARIPGWGIGLAFVRAMTEAHGGSVSLVSSADTGTVFTVRLPKTSPL
jgi:signal transduction histidine kinase